MNICMVPRHCWYVITSEETLAVMVRRMIRTLHNIIILYYYYNYMEQKEPSGMYRLSVLVTLLGSCHTA